MNLFWVILIILIVVIVLIWQNQTIELNYYQLKVPNLSPALKDFKILQISDLHLETLRIDLEALIELMEEEAPDLIVMTGDIFHGNDAEIPVDQITYLGRSMAEIAPVYAVPGNHDYRYLEEDWVEVLENAHIQPLLDEAVSIEKDGARFILMGLTEHREMYEKQEELTHDPLSNIDMEGLGADDFKILLAHHPEYFETYVQSKDYAPDLTLSGHTHGGGLRLPFVGGIFSPSDTDATFPHYDYGLYTSQKDPSKRMIINRGLAPSPSWALRVFNRSEMTVIEIF